MSNPNSATNAPVNARQETNECPESIKRSTTQRSVRIGAIYAMSVVERDSTASRGSAISNVRAQPWKIYVKSYATGIYSPWKTAKSPERRATTHYRMGLSNGSRGSRLAASAFIYFSVSTYFRSAALSSSLASRSRCHSLARAAASNSSSCFLACNLSSSSCCNKDGPYEATGFHFSGH